jgi:hypothetical protein
VRGRVLATVEPDWRGRGLPQCRLSTRTKAWRSLMPDDPTADSGAGSVIAPEGADPALEKRYVLFFDFLGASSAARSWPRERVYKFVDLLIAIAAIQSSEDISGSAQPDGSYRLLLTPEITTFSDNIVVSYPHAPDKEYRGFRRLSAFWAETVCADAVRILSRVAEVALRIGLLIRGGLSFGELYHQKGVVFGEAFVDAYTLEQRIAHYPRIIVSDRIIAKLTHMPAENIDALLQDADGMWHLNYFARMYEGQPDCAGHWKRAHLDRIKQEIDQLRRSSDPLSLARRAKWEWFREHFETATEAFASG